MYDMKHLISLILMFVLSSNSLGQSRYVTEFSSFGNYDLKGKSFYIESGNPNIKSNDLEFKYYSDIITQTLIRSKAVPTNDQYSADMCILLDYSLTDASYQAIESKPVWGPTGIKSVSSSSTTYGNATGQVNAYGYGNSVSANGSGYGSSTTNTTKTYTYNYGITGYNQSTVNVSQYNRTLNLYAYDNKEREGEPIMLWKVNAESSGYSNDLSGVFPYMAEVIAGYPGTNSQGKKEFYVSESNPDALAMKTGLYLKNNVVVNPTNFGKGNLKGIYLRCVSLGETYTTLVFMCRKNDVRSIKFSENTYIIYKNERIPVHAVGIPPNNSQMMGKSISLSDEKKVICLDFPIKMNKGDIFEFVSYRDKKETKLLFNIKDIVLE